MLTAALEDRFRARLGARAHGLGDATLRFAVDFAQLVVRVLPDEFDRESVGAVADALRARTDLADDEARVLLELALSPENRLEVSDHELRAFGARFGKPAEKAMRAAIADEVDLEAFAERYGPAESLLLLDSLFAVCAVDGAIDPAEIGRLQASADRLGVDPMLVGLLFRKHDVRHAEGDVTFDLSGKETVTIGRSAPADIRLPDPQVAVRHARLRRTESGWRLEDLGSGRPTILRGTPVREAPIQLGDEMRVGPYRLALHDDGEALTAFGTDSLSSLSMRGVTRRIDTADGPLTLLDDIGFTVFSGEVIALVGPSGAGKTTLLQAIAGILPPDSGEIVFDGGDFHRMLASDRSLVGIVPQEDVVHGELSVEEALRYAARLRFPADVPRDGLDGAIDRVLGELDIAHIRASRIGTALQRGVSGGQRKRVNLGQELLTTTTRVLFLDEPTSGLDPQTAQDIVTQVRQLADDGRIVFLVTHDVSPTITALVDHLLVLAKGGRIAWFGPPTEACAHFGVASVDEIFARLPSKTPEDWQTTYRESLAWRKYVRTREHLLGLEDDAPPAAEGARSRPSPWLQFATLTRRYATVKARDWVGTGVLLAQAPILAIAFGIVFAAPQRGTLFVLVLSALWFGASAAIRELISERPIWRREARVGVGLVPYLASKVVVLSTLVTLQCVVLTSILWAWLGMAAYGFGWAALTGVVVATGLTGMTMGLALSAMFSSSEAAVGSLPLVLIPQIAFGGLLVKLKEMGLVATAITHLTITRFAFDAALKTGDRLALPEAKGLRDQEEYLPGVLWDIGFRTTTGADDIGLHPLALYGVMGAFAIVALAAATWLTHRSRLGA